MAFESATPPPFTFAIEHPAQGLAAGGAAEPCPVADRLQGRFMAPWPGAAGRRQNNFCCVTTRRRRRWCLYGLRRSAGTLAARTLRCGVLSFGCRVLSSSGLALGRLPEAEQSPAFGILAVTLVPTSRLVSATTALAQAEPRSRSSRSRLALIMTAAHGRNDSQGTARGERANVLLGRYSTRAGTGGHQSMRAGMNQTGKETVRDRGSQGNDSGQP